MFDVDGFLRSTEFYAQVAAFISAILSAILSGFVTDLFTGM